MNSLQAYMSYLHNEKFIGTYLIFTWIIVCKKNLQAIAYIYLLNNLQDYKEHKLLNSVQEYIAYLHIE